MEVFSKNLGDLTIAGARTVPYGLQAVIEIREMPEPGILVAYVQVGLMRTILLYARSPMWNGGVQQEGPFSPELFLPGPILSGPARKIRHLVADRGMDPVEFLREVREHQPVGWHEEPDDDEPTDG